MKKLIALLTALLMVLSVCSALADYPEREVTLVIPYGAGGTTDVNGRFFASILEEKLGTSVVATNVKGSSGYTGAQQVLEKPADGYTVMVCAETMGTYRTMGTGEGKIGYDDFTVITPLVGDPKIIVVGLDSPYQTMQDLLDAIKADPGSVTMSHSGPGGSGHNQGLVLGQFGYEVAMVAYNGGTDALLGVINGEIDFTNPNISTLGDHLTGDTADLRALAVFSNTRLAAYPDIPAITEFAPELEEYVNIPYTVLSVVVAKDTPAEIVDVLRAAVAETVADQRWTDFVTKNAADPLYAMYTTEEEMKAFYDHWMSVVCWMQYDNQVAPNSPADFGIERP